MFKDIISNEEAKNFLINELKSERQQGTYIFYGEDRDLVMEFALVYAKALTCRNAENDFCGVCESCKRMDSLTHGDLEVYEDSNGIKIDRIRELAYRASTASYEGGNRIFILRDVEKLKKESANALLKLIEEPEKGDFFILTANSLNILPTIKSRAIFLKIKNRSAEELGVSPGEYNFFLGKGREILDYLQNKDTGIDLNSGEPYSEIGTFIKNYAEEPSIINKIKIYKALRDFFQNRQYISEIEKMTFAENISFAVDSDRVLVQEICSYMCHLVKDYDRLESLISVKNMVKMPVNLKLLIKVFINEIY